MDRAQPGSAGEGRPGNSKVLNVPLFWSLIAPERGSRGLCQGCHEY